MTAGAAGDLAVVTERQVIRRHGTIWTEQNGPSGLPMQAASVVAGAGGATTVYALTETAWSGTGVSGGVFVSEDGGAVWRQALRGLTDRITEAGSGPPPHFRAVSASLGQGAAAYVGFEGLRLGPGAAGLYNGVARTTDGGRTWHIVHRESNKPSPAMTGSWLEERAVMPGPDIWFDAPYDLGVSPRDPDLVYVTDLFRTYRTVDGGGHWAQVHSKPRRPRTVDHTRSRRDHHVRRPRRSARSRTRVHQLHRHRVVPQRGRRPVMDDVEPGHAAGLAQHHLLGGVRSGSARHHVGCVQRHPRSAAAEDVAHARSGHLPRRRRGVTRRRAVVVTRERACRLAPSPTCWSIREARCSRERCTRACSGAAYSRARDDGVTWSAKNEGLAGPQPFAWRITLSPSGRLYLVVSRRSENGRIGDEGDGALYVSDDGADHWTRVALPAGTNGPTGLLIDPADPQRLYLSAWGVYHADGDTGGGIFLSTDAGRTWRSIFADGQHVYDVTLDPRTGALYASGFDQAAWRSADRGATWTRIRGFNFKWGHRVIPDPASPDRIYITTFGGSVWHGPAAGDPDASEDVVEPTRNR